MAWTGVAGKARSGAERLARHGRHGTVWMGRARQDWLGRPGGVRRRRHGGKGPVSMAGRDAAGLACWRKTRHDAAQLACCGCQMAAEWGSEWAPSFLSPELMDFIKAEPEYVFRIEDGEEAMGIDAQTAGSELDRIRRRDGTIRPAAVVDEARPEEAPLHRAFEWRDPVAAEQWREHQASTLIKVVRVVPAAPVETRVASVRPVTQAAAPVVERYDPMAKEVLEAVGLVVEARRKVEELKLRTQRMGDRKSMAVLGVAFGMLDEAHEALTNCQVSSKWERELQRAQ